MKWLSLLAVTIALYEAYALWTRRAPTFTALAERELWVKVLEVVAVVVIAVVGVMHVARA